MARNSQDFAVTEVDLAIVEQLRAHGRATNQQIAETLGLTAPTVSSRIRRLEEADKLRVVAVSDFAAHGFDVLIEVAVEVDGRPADAVAEDLAALPEVFAVHMVTGRYDIDLLLTLHSIDELPALVFDRIHKIAGVRSILPSIVLDIVKYRFDIAPIDEAKVP